MTIIHPTTRSPLLVSKAEAATWLHVPRGYKKTSLGTKGTLPTTNPARFPLAGRRPSTREASIPQPGGPANWGTGETPTYTSLRTNLAITLQKNSRYGYKPCSDCQWGMIHLPSERLAEGTLLVLAAGGRDLYFKKCQRGAQTAWQALHCGPGHDGRAFESAGRGRRPVAYACARH